MFPDRLVDNVFLYCQEHGNNIHSSGGYFMWPPGVYTPQFSQLINTNDALRTGTYNKDADVHSVDDASVGRAVRRVPPGNCARRRSPV